MKVFTVLVQEDDWETSTEFFGIFINKKVAIEYLQKYFLEIEKANYGVYLFEDINVDKLHFFKAKLKGGYNKDYRITIVESVNIEVG